MVTIRGIREGELERFAAVDPATPDMAEAVREHWADGSGRPEWTLIAEDGGRAVGRAAFFTQPFGCGLDVREGRLAGLWLADGTPRATARELLDAVADLARGVTLFIEQRLNPEVHRDIPLWRGVLEDAGFTLFHEKEGFVWTDEGGELPEPQHLTFRSLAEVGRDAYASAMAATIPGTLDRNDRFYLDACGPLGWGREMAAAAEPEDEPTWLLAYEPDRMLAGYVGVARFEEGVGTIAHIGVVPDRRGRGYVNELLRTANRVARASEYRSMLSDVDTLNAPMLAAMERNGHRPGVRPWHVWAYRREVPGTNARIP
jgi:ribosomal protein S18 acetylase RimI-like enzyme